MADNEQNLAQKNRVQEELQKEYLKSLDEIETGQLINGVIVAVTQDQVFIDIGYKSEGKISLDQFDPPPVEGDTVQVVLISKEGRNGEVIVSKRKADERIVWQNIKDAFDKGLPIEGQISRVVKGGFEVSLGGNNRGFNPISKMDIMKVDEPDKFLNTKSLFHVERLYSDNRVNIILSRRRWLEEEAQRKRDIFFKDTSENDIVTGIVKSFTSFGAFIDLGGFDGLLHINDMGWGHVARPKEHVQKGENLRLKVIRLDPENKKINLSLKELTENPWENFTDRYQLSDVVDGKVTKLTDFGAFVELENGIEGLVHISEFSWTKHLQHPKEMLNIDDPVKVKILGFDLEAHKISLGIKQTQPNPWDSIEENFSEKMKFTGIVKKITATGAFIELEKGIDAFLHRDDFSWTKQHKSLHAVLKIGDEAEVIVLESDAEKHNIRVGMKQLENNPWRDLTGSTNSIMKVKVMKVTKFGVFVQTENGIEGLIPKAHLADARQTDLNEELEKYTEGEEITVSVLELDSEKQKLTFSIREMARNQERQEMAKYITETEDTSSIPLADFLNPDDIK